MSFSVKKLLFGIVEVLIGAWLIYQLNFKFAEKSLTTTSTLIFWPAICIVFLGVSSLIEAAQARKNVVLKVNILIFFALIFLGEIALRQFKFYSTYFEKNNQEPYVSVYEEPTFDSLGFHREPNSDFVYFNGEFDYARTCNNWGYTNRNLPKSKPENEIWFFVFGDSFCEGAGVSFNKAVPAQLENYFSGFDSTFTIKFYNFGMAGSDVVYEYYLWDNHLKSKNPDGVVFIQNTTDIQDLKVRGGIERFNGDNDVNYREPPKWEWIYASSHFLRAFFHRVFEYDFSLIHEDNQKELTQESVNIINNTLSKVREEHPNIFVFTFPQLEEFRNGNYTFDEFSNWALNTEWVTDLSQPFYDLKNKGIALEEVYWPMDRHFNEKGYTILSNLIAKKLEPELLKLVAEKKKTFNNELQTAN